MAGLHTYLCVCMYAHDMRVCTHRCVFKQWGNQFCSSVQQPPALPPLPDRKEPLGESYSHIKMRSRTLSREQLRRSCISLIAHPPLPSDPISLPVFFHIGPHLSLSFAKPCCLCLSGLPEITVNEVVFLEGPKSQTLSSRQHMLMLKPKAS